MNSILPDIHGKLDVQLVEVLVDVDASCRAEGIEFCVVGAAARDFIAGHLYGVRPTRATNDTDFAIHIVNWDQYASLTRRLVDERHFSKTRLFHRYSHSNGRLVDLVPFGGVADAKNVIAWPDPDESRMTVLGFQEACKAACTVVVSLEPKLELRVVTLAGLAVLKLIAWDEKYPDRDKDAADVRLIIDNYIDCGNHDALYGEHADMLDDPSFDFATASARLLGRHMGTMMDSQTRERVIHILEQESQPGTSLRLPCQMHGIGADLAILETTAARIGRVLTGIRDTEGV